MTTLVRAENISRTLESEGKTVSIVRDVSMTIEAGRFVMIVGPSGSGKTTLLTMLAGLERPTSGTLDILGVDARKASESELTKLRRESLSFVFQAPRLFMGLDALGNIAEVLAMRGAGLGAAREAAQESLALVGLGERARASIKSLSGGERQRVAIARSLAAKPKLLFADEPTAALDTANALRVCTLLREAADRGCAVVLVTHDLRLETYADEIITLHDGAVESVSRK
jgi:putative ABC transport system ATP-binding protein